MINLNDFAKEITLKEGKKLSLTIAQVKELTKIIFTKDLQTVISIWEKYNKVVKK